MPPAGLPVASDRELEQLCNEAYHRLHGRMLEDAEEELERRAALAMETHSRGDTAADVLERDYIIRG